MKTKTALRKVGWYAIKVVVFLMDFIGLIIVAFVIWLLVRVAETRTIGDMISILKQINWPQTVILFGIIFLIPIYRLLNSLASKLSTATLVKIGNLEIHKETVADIIVEREKLRTGIYMASVDDDPQKIELEYLGNVERKMPDRLDQLTEAGRLEVLETAIELGIADKILHPKEYDALKNLAWRFNISQDKLDEKIINAVVNEHIKGVTINLPLELNNQFEQAKVIRTIL
jgi:hypothetical protein